MSLDIAEIRSLADDATPGPWAIWNENIHAKIETDGIRMSHGWGVDDGDDVGRSITIVVEDRDYDAPDSIPGDDAQDWCEQQAAADREFIVAAREYMVPLCDEVEALQAQLARIRAVHRPFGIYDICGHTHAPGEDNVREVDAVGLVCKDGLMYDVCYECCTFDGLQNEECAFGHEHANGSPLCPTVAAIEGVPFEAPAEKET